jgi:putative transport protein
MTGILETLRGYPELAVFFAVGVGYWIGNYKIGQFSLGTVTAALIMGILLGQFHFEPSRDFKWGFFLLFLFANGYSAGPQFVQALKKDGIKPMLLSLVMCMTALLSAYFLARLLNLDVGLAAGLFSGGTTQSAAMGTATDAINGLAISAAEKKMLTSHIVVADALCYVFGALGVIWFCSYIAPFLMRIDLVSEAKALEDRLGIKENSSGLYSATQRFNVRAFRVDPKSKLVGKMVYQIEKREPNDSVFVYRIWRRGKVFEAFGDSEVKAGDTLVLYGHTPSVVELGSKVGTEELAEKFVDFQIAFQRTVITNRNFCQKSIEEIRALPELRSVTARSLRRGGEEIPAGLWTPFHPGDIIELVGPAEAVERVARLIGYALRPATVTSLTIVGLGIFVGGLIGIPYLVIGGLKLTLTLSVGVLLAGLFAGWLRTVQPVFPSIPEASVQVLISLGLAVFVASVGMQAGPLFIGAVKELGLMLFLCGMVVTLAPLLIGLYFGRYVLKMHPVILLGAVAGAQTYTGGMAAVQERSKSRVAILGYTVPYATSNILLTFFGSVIVSLLAV